MNTLFKQRAVQILTFGYLLGVSCYVWIYTTGLVDTLYNYLWGLVFLGVLPVLGGISGILISRNWGFLSSALGRAILFFSAGVAVWGVGGVIYSYYNIALAIEVPYPSIADLFFVLSIPFLIVGLINLGKGIGRGYKLRALRCKAIFAIIPLFIIATSYHYFTSVGGDGFASFTDASILEIVLDFLYSIQDALLITTIALIYGLSYRVFGGRFKQPINLLFVAFLFYYLTDFAYSYTVKQETYYVANWVDLLYLNTMFLISIGVNALDIQGITSRMRSELVMFAPRANEAINKLILEIIGRQASIMGLVAWDEAMKVPGLTIDMKNNNLSVEGDPKIVLGQLVGRYEGLFGNASLQICKDVARKFFSQLPQEQIPEILK